MNKISKTEMVKRFKAFEMAYRELNDGWDLYNTGEFSEDYPFNTSFCELQPDVINWCAESIKKLEKRVTIADMVKSRRCVNKWSWERINGIETDLEDCGQLFIYFDSFFIGITKDGRFHAVVCGGDKILSQLEAAEDYMWEMFLKDELNGTQ